MVYKYFESNQAISKFYFLDLREQHNNPIYFGSSIIQFSILFFFPFVSFFPQKAGYSSKSRPN